ncbi:MAG: YdcF family protein [Oscillospiraceae bacterium]|nr:YdcF family protein [Oscillospiraceae bacterium]
MKKDKTKINLKKKKSFFRRAVKFFFFTGAAFALICVLINLYVMGSTRNAIITADEAAALDADCVIVLGAGVVGGQPTFMLRDRLLRGIEVYEKGVNCEANRGASSEATKKLLMSGDHGRDHYDEVNVMKSFAIEKGVPSKDVFMDHAGFSTYESMYRARDIFGAEKVIIVTQKYHLFRALYIARALGLEAHGVDSDLRTYAGQPYYDAREALARIKDFGMSILKPKPTYLGDAIPISGNGNLTNDKEDTA